MFSMYTPGRDTGDGGQPVGPMRMYIICVCIQQAGILAMGGNPAGLVEKSELVAMYRKLQVKSVVKMNFYC